MQNNSINFTDIIILLLILMIIIGIIIFYKKHKQIQKIVDVNEIIDLEKEDKKIIQRAIEEKDEELLKELLNSSETSFNNKKIIEEYLNHKNKDK